MIFKFKNGYTVTIHDTEGKSREECLKIAKEAVQNLSSRLADGDNRVEKYRSLYITKTQDGYNVCDKYLKPLNVTDYETVEEAKAAIDEDLDSEESTWSQFIEDDASLKRNIETNVSFSIQRMKNAIKGDSPDLDAFKRELTFLERDMMTDASEKHKNYVNTFRPEVLKKITDQYDEAIKVVEKAGEFDPDIKQKLGDLYWLQYIIKENWKLHKRDFTAYIVTDDGISDESKFQNLQDAITFVKTIVNHFSNKGSNVIEARIIDNTTGEIIFDPIINIDNSGDYIQDSKRCKDAPPPYFDPTDNPVIESKASVERLKKELAHPEKDDQLLNDYYEILLEIDELIDRGSQALIDAGWTKIDARHAIAMKYDQLVKALRMAKQSEKALTLRNKIKELKKAWDLER